jgi:hypothetical protein
MSKEHDYHLDPVAKPNDQRTRAPHAEPVELSAEVLGEVQGGAPSRSSQQLAKQVIQAIGR